ncbi:hypothetical protein LM602_06390 [Candidatus Acetothermia bacterium]|jgi:hypothetical protein|nr:hypothetical protein [Candidatus Acetothermia bacterium]MCI2432165.1 hypothetical protein [Candidatus Acetothermia bacterium]MCI2436142.1 hypothetical protein [Candidatus Acetothermia bacterium]
MPRIEVELKLEEIAQALKRLTPGERETLAILLNPKLRAELKNRWQKARTELKTGKTLSEEELFST